MDSCYTKVNNYPMYIRKHTYAEEKPHGYTTLKEHQITALEEKRLKLFKSKQNPILLEIVNTMIESQTP